MHGIDNLDGMEMGHCMEIGHGMEMLGGMEIGHGMEMWGGMEIGHGMEICNLRAKKHNVNTNNPNALY